MVLPSTYPPTHTQQRATLARNAAGIKHTKTTWYVDCLQLIIRYQVLAMVVSASRTAAFLCMTGCFPGHGPLTEREKVARRKGADTRVLDLLREQ